MLPLLNVCSTSITETRKEWQAETGSANQNGAKKQPGTAVASRKSVGTRNGQISKRDSHERQPAHQAADLQERGVPTSLRQSLPVGYMWPLFSGLRADQVSPAPSTSAGPKGCSMAGFLAGSASLYISLSLYHSPGQGSGQYPHRPGNQAPGKEGTT